MSRRWQAMNPAMRSQGWRAVESTADFNLELDRQVVRLIIYGVWMEIGLR